MCEVMINFPTDGSGEKLHEWKFCTAVQLNFAFNPQAITLVLQYSF